VKKKLAFIDHNFHQKSKSGNFIREILRKKFVIDDFWWSLKDQYKLIDKIKNYENFFFFQSLLPLEDMLKIRDKNIMWAPMYDNLDTSFNYWKKIKYLDLKILAFSSPVKKLSVKFNCRHLYLKYALKNKIGTKIKKKLNIFFWFRNNISFYDWINIFKTEDINVVKYFNCPDPGKNSEVIDYKDIKNYKIKFINKKFLPKNEYLKMIKNCDVFVCPRKQEGIGMSFLEALSMGKYLISKKETTMNEYINNQDIGIFFNKYSKQKLSLRQIKKGQNFRNKYAKIIFNKWEKDKKMIINFFIISNKKNKGNSLYYFYFLNDYLRKYKFLFKRWILS